MRGFEPALALELGHKIFMTPSSSVIQSFKLWSKLCTVEVISLLFCSNLNLEFLEKNPLVDFVYLDKYNNVTFLCEWVLIGYVI